ncbi:recombinase family protein, partial [Nocardioides aquaticus]
MTTAGVYVRISDDQAGDALGVKRQEQDCRKIAALRDWEVSSVYSDNDVSAYKRSVRRPAFERLLQDLEKGVISAVVVYDLDRFARQPRDLERAIDLFEGSHLRFATVQGDIDLSSPDGRTMARVMVAFANKSSDDTSRRTTRKHLELAQKGMPVGPRAYGWRAGKITIDPTEAAIIRDGARQLMAGMSLGAVTDQWNEKGYKSSLGNRWVRQTVRQMYLNPRLAGYRVYRGEMLRDEAGEPVMGMWEPILDNDTWTALVTRIAPPETRQGYRPGGRKYLLSG